MEELDKFQFTINSDDGTKLNYYTDYIGNTHTDSSWVRFNFNGRRELICGPNEYYTLQISGGSIPLTYYNINSYNNKIVVTNYTNASLGMYVDSNYPEYSTITFTIQTGNYTIYSLVTALNQSTASTSDGTILEYAQGTSTNGTAIQFGDLFYVIYDSTRELLQIYALSTTAYQGLSGLYQSTTVPQISSTSTAYKLLGFKSGDTNTFTTVSGYTYLIVSTTLIYLSYTNCIFLTSQQLRTNGIDSNNSSGGTDILATIHLTQNAPSILTFALYYECKLNCRDLTNFELILRDQDRNIICLNGADWLLTFDVKKYKDEQSIANMEQLMEQSAISNNMLKRRRL
jgi:hypothetical protein